MIFLLYKAKLGFFFVVSVHLVESLLDLLLLYYYTCFFLIKYKAADAARFYVCS